MKNIDPKKVKYVTPLMAENWCRVYYQGLYYGEIFRRGYTWQTREGENTHKQRRDSSTKFSAAKYLIQNGKGIERNMDGVVQTESLERHAFPGLIEMYDEFKLEKECTDGYCHAPYPIDSTEMLYHTRWRFKTY